MITRLSAAVSKGKRMAAKKSARKKSSQRQMVGFRVRPAMYEDLAREAKKRQIRMSEEIERRLIVYDEMMMDAERVVREIEEMRFDDLIDRISDQTARKL